MSKDIFGQSEEVTKFLKAVDEGKKPKSYKKFMKNHKFKDPKTDVLNHYFMIINIPEKMKEHYSGKTSPAPRFGRMHKTVRGFGEWSKAKDFLNIFPESSVQDIRCTGDDTCLVCQRTADLFDKHGIKKVNKSWMAPEGLDKNTEKICKQLISGVDGGLRAKNKVVFNAIVFERDKDKKWQKSIQRFVMSKFYWERDFHDVLFESREEDKDDWTNEDHCDDVFTYNDMTKPLSEFEEVEQTEIFLRETESIYPIPWDMLEGRMLHYEEIGKVEDKGVVKFKKNYPYFPPALVKDATGDMKKAMKAKSKAAGEMVDFINENIEDLCDLDEYFPESITADEQRELLNVAKEKVTENKILNGADEEDAVENVFGDDEVEKTEDDSDVGEIGEGIEEAPEGNSSTDDMFASGEDGEDEEDAPPF